MKISYIILSYKSAILIEDCIKSILTYHKSTTFEIIVVDNSPKEEQKYVQDVCDNISYPIIFISNENLGYGQGNNVGVRTASGEIICIVNPDVRFIQPYTHIVDSVFVNKSIAMLGFKQIGGFDLSFYLKPEYYFPFLNSFIVKLFNKLNLYNSRFFFLSGACFFVRKDMFLEIGLFDEKIFMYNEESDINTRFLNRDFKIKYVKSIKYMHLVGDRKSVSHTLLNYDYQSLTYYLKKFGFNVRRHFFMKSIEYKLRSKERYVALKKFLSNL